MTKSLQKPSSQKKSSSKKLDPLGLRFDEEMTTRLVKCADRLGQTKTALGQQAVVALVEAIERANYRMVIPLEISVAYVPTAARKTGFKPYREEIIEDTDE